MQCYSESKSLYTSAQLPCITAIKVRRIYLSVPQKSNGAVLLRRSLKIQQRWLKKRASPWLGVTQPLSGVINGCNITFHFFVDYLQVCETTDSCLTYCPEITLCIDQVVDWMITWVGLFRLQPDFRIQMSQKAIIMVWRCILSVISHLSGFKF